GAALVTSGPSYDEHEVAERAPALMLALARRIRTFDEGVRAGDWSLARGQPIQRVAGSTLGIVGFGRIGQMLAGKAQGLGMTIVVHHPRRPEAELRAAGVEPVSLGELAAQSDFVNPDVLASARWRHL